LLPERGRQMPIGRIEFDVSSSLFIKELLKRQIELRSRPRIGYTLVCPNDLRWWYWLEFGTAGKQDASAPYKSEHSGTYDIDPVDKHSLAWTEGGVTRFAFHVDHPGIRPHLIYRSVREQILDNSYAFVAEAMEQSGISVAALDRVLRERVMPNARALMGTQLEMQAPGVKQQNPFSKSHSKSTGQNLGKAIEPSISGEHRSETTSEERISEARSRITGGGRVLD
jgi:hypothetical protein